MEPNAPVLLELRCGANGALPYLNGETYLEIEVSDETIKQRVLAIATEFTTTNLGVQSIFETRKDGKVTPYESCFVDFVPEHADKENFINKLLTFMPSEYHAVINEIKADKCTQVTISFPTVQGIVFVGGSTN